MAHVDGAVRLLSEITRNALPYLLASRAINPLVALLFIPLLIYVLQLLPTIRQCLTTNVSTIVLIDKPLSYNPPRNNQYFAAIWYIKEILKVPGITYKCEERSDESGYGFNARKDLKSKNTYTPFVAVSSVPRTRFVFRDKTIYMSCAMNGEKMYQRYELHLSGSASVIEEFMIYSLQRYLKFKSSRRKNPLRKRCVYIWQNDDWQENILRNNKSFETIFLSKETERELRADLQSFRDAKGFYRKHAIAYKRGYLLHGPPGTGKTSTYYALAREMNTDIYRVSLNQYNSGEAFQDAIRKIEKGSVVAIDDIDHIPVTRGQDSKVEPAEQELKRPDNLGGFVSRGMEPKDKGNVLVLSDLLSILDGYDCLKGCVVVFTTNNPERLDAALIRPGRIDRKFYLGPPDMAGLRAIWQHFYEESLPEGFAPADPLPTTAELINSIIVPNRNDPSKALVVLQERLAAV